MFKRPKSTEPNGAESGVNTISNVENRFNNKKSKDFCRQDQKFCFHALEVSRYMKRSFFSSYASEIGIETCVAE